jgi:hypothetical protein
MTLCNPAVAFLQHQAQLEAEYIRERIARGQLEPDRGDERADDHGGGQDGDGQEASRRGKDSRHG